MPAGTPPSQVVALYDQSRVRWAVWGQTGSGVVLQYAQMNGSQLTRCRVSFGPEFWMVQGYPLRPILVDAAGQRTFGMAGPVVGGEVRRIKAQATAEK